MTLKTLVSPEITLIAAVHLSYSYNFIAPSQHACKSQTDKIYSPKEL